MKRVLIVGSGDVARRLIPWLAQRFRVYALVRRRESAENLRALGAKPLFGDLDDRHSLWRLAGIADAVLHFAPPAEEGEHDRRTARLLAALTSRRSLPQRLVYISTTGVYGNCDGAWIDETQPCRPRHARARRRLDAEWQLRRFGRRTHRTQVCILRAGGIYAVQRLPESLLRTGLPMPVASRDVHANLIHADDLARAAKAALFRGRPGRAYNAVDDSDMKYGDYFDLVADYCGFPKPMRLDPDDLAGKGKWMMPASFMQAPRRLSNRRLHKELRVVLRYPTVRSSLVAGKEQ